MPKSEEACRACSGRPLQALTGIMTHVLLSLGNKARILAKRVLVLYVEVSDPCVSAHNKTTWIVFLSTASFEKYAPIPSLTDILPVEPIRQEGEGRTRRGRKSPRPSPRVVSSSSGKETREESGNDSPFPARLGSSVVG